MKNARLQACMRAAMQTSCPTERELFEFQRHRLSPDRMEQIRLHLPTCAACRQIQQDVVDFLEDDVSLPATGEVEQEFRAVWSRIRGDQPSSSVRPFPQAGAGGRRLSTPHSLLRRGLMPAAMAASVMLATGGLLWGLWAQRRLEEQSRAQAELTNRLQGVLAQPDASRRAIAPRANIQLIELFSDSLVRGDAGGRPPEVKGSHGRELVFILNGQGLAGASYQIELRDRNDRLLWRDDKVRLDQTGNVMVSLPADYLQRGRYLMSITGGNSTLTYTFDLMD